MYIWTASAMLSDITPAGRRIVTSWLTDVVIMLPSNEHEKLEPTGVEFGSSSVVVPLSKRVYEPVDASNVS